MPDAPTPAPFLHLLAAAILGDGEPSALAAQAHAALADVFRAQKSLVLDVQFTGFAQKGQLVGGVDPVLLRAAGHLITQRVARVGFTPDATAGDLEALFGVLPAAPGTLGADGVVGALKRAEPHGIYLSTNAGEVYRPPARPAATPGVADGAPAAEAAAPAAEPTTETPAAEPAGQGEQAGQGPPSPAPGPSPAGPGWEVPPGEATELAEFEILEAFEVEATPAEAALPAPAAGPAAGKREEEPPSSDMYHFFRAQGGEETDPGRLPGMLQAADNVSRFDEMADTAAKAAVQLIRSDSHPQAVELLDALVRESERPDRSRFFRESAVQALRRAVTPEMLHRLLELLPQGGSERERILRLLRFVGGDAVGLLEGMVYRTGDVELRREIVQTLLGVQGMTDKLIAHAVQDPSPVRVRMLLELAAQGGLDPDVGRRWAGEAALHRDAAVRVDAARTLAAQGGRAAVRVLVDLLGDSNRLVRREAIQALGTLADTAAVPFLARVLNDSGEEEQQVAAAAALGRIGSPEVVPHLLGLLGKRSLFSGKKVGRVKLAAVQAIARTGTPAAREALATLAAGRDELADEARRLLEST